MTLRQLTSWRLLTRMSVECHWFLNPIFFFFLMLPVNQTARLLVFLLQRVTDM